MIKLYWNTAIAGRILPLAWGFLSIILAGCGTLAAPVWQATTPTLSAVTEDDGTQAVAAATSLPTDTPIPPTSTPTPAPTSTATPEPTPTLEPTAQTVSSPIDRLVAVRDPQNGKLLFETFQEAANYACSTCHSATSEDKLVGPGLLNIKDRAPTRIEGQSAAEYLYNSIIDTNAYIVEGFDAELMPKNWPDIYSNIEIFDIVAYLLTLEGEADLDESADEG